MCKNKKILQLLMLCFCICSVTPIVIYAEEQRIEDEIQQAGSYPFTITYVDDEGVEEQETYYVTIKYRKTVVSQIIQEAIDAHDIEIDKESFEKTKKEDYILLAKAKAWNTENGSEIPITKIDVKKNKTSQSVFDISFMTDNGTKTIVTATIKEQDSKVIHTVNNTQIYTNYAVINMYQSINIVILLLIFLPLIILVLQFVNMHRKYTEINKLLYKEDK